MKRKVREALKQLRTELDEHNDNIAFITVHPSELKTLVKWAEKQAAKKDGPDLRAGDTVVLRVVEKGDPTRGTVAEFGSPGESGVLVKVEGHDRVLWYARSEVTKVKS